MIFYFRKTQIKIIAEPGLHLIVAFKIRLSLNKISSMKCSLLKFKTNSMSTIKNLFVVFVFLLFAIDSGAQDVAQWRGPNRDGIYPEKNLLKVWPEKGPNLLWSTEVIGVGYSSPVITKDKLLINGEINQVAYVFAFDLNGKLLWKTPNGKEFFGEGYSANFPGARSAPTVYDDLVYVCSGLGRIACLETSTGKERWSVNTISDLGGKLNMFGNSESLLVDEHFVYCMPGGEIKNVAALDRYSGKLVWTSKALGDPVSFCSPIMIKLPQRNVLVTLSHEYLMGLDAKNGELLWSVKEDSVKLEGDYCNTPIYADGFIYQISGIEKGTGAFKLELSPDGKSVKTIWKNNQVKNPMGGFVKIGSRIYATSDDKKLKVLDAETGHVVETLGGMKGSLIAADNLLFCYTDNGYVNLIKGIGSKLEVVSKFKITKGEKEHFAHPVIANGVLYIRHGNVLMAYQVR
jgi:outer membrane protein assembly factor BamB